MRSSEEFSVCSRKGRTLVFVICILGQTVKLTESEGHALEMPEREGHAVNMPEREGRTVKMPEREGHTVMEMSESGGHTVQMSESEGHTVQMSASEGHAVEMPESEGPTVEMPESEGHTVEMSESEGHTVEMSESEGHTVEMSESEGHTVEMSESEGHTVMEMSESGGHTVEMSESEGHTVEMSASEGHVVEMPEREGPTLELSESEGYTVVEMSESEGHTMEMSESEGHTVVEMSESEGHTVEMPESEGHTVEMPESEGHTLEMPEREGNIVEMFDTKGKSDNVMQYDVLLNSYMSSGSTLSGIVLGSRDDSFYLYEPLWKCARWVFWRGYSALCRTDRYLCREVAAGDTLEDKFYDNSDKRPGCSLEKVRNILHDFYDCKFDALESQAIQTDRQIKTGGPSWLRIRDCIKQRSPNKKCVHTYAPQLCRAATHRVSKVLRLSTDIYGPIMEERKNLKVFHLFRDPRAIINSRMGRSWFMSRMPKNGILDMTKSLCDKMLYDFHEGKKLMEKYPGRFKFLFYEDLNKNPLEKVNAMYRFVGMSLNETKYLFIKNIPVFRPEKQQTRNAKNTAYWWRGSMDWKLIQGIDDICADVYKALGYISIKNLDDFRDLSIPSVNFNRQYLL